MSSGKRHSTGSRLLRILCGTCPDEHCQAKLYFPSYDTSIECTACGQRHEKSNLKSIEEVTDPEVAQHNILKNILLGNVKPKKGPEDVKVLGLSNYGCKLLSPILTKHGMEKSSGKAKLLTSMGQNEMFDCSVLSDRAFLIEQEHIEVIGYGRDRTGTMTYLKDTLDCIKKWNGGEERLIPIHCDGDGHCLVHAVSRALVGRELFWHALRQNLAIHFRSNLPTYKNMFADFVDDQEWELIINECDPDFIPDDSEPLGLRNIHLFGLANVMKRTIILLDSLAGIQSGGDYSGIFLPGLVDPSKCVGRDGVKNKPLCIAWSSSGRNHYIALVGIKGKPQPKLHKSMIQKAWGMPESYISKYVDFDENLYCTIGGDKCLQDRYIQRLVAAMEEVFYDLYKVHPRLVTDVHQYIYKVSGIVSVKTETAIRATQLTVEERRLFRCLTCDALTEYQVSPDLFDKTGSLYKLAVATYGALRTDKKYKFPLQGFLCTYDKEKDCLVPEISLSHCAFCQGDHMRLVNGDGSIQYINGDRMTSRSNGGKCLCGFKHFWNGNEYDNLPEVFPISLEWNGKVVAENVIWFQFETDPALNSNVYEVAQTLVQKHFPGEFGSERLVQRVVDTIMRQTAPPKSDSPKEENAPRPVDDNAWSAEVASKIIITGHAKQTLHKEELNKSQTEKRIRQQITANAGKQQRKSTVVPKKIPPKKTEQESVSKVPNSDNPPPVKLAAPVSERNSETMKVRLATSDGRQLLLELPADVTYSALQDIINKAVSVPPERQKIRLGFPPRELKAPAIEDEGSKVPLQHGDKLTLDIVPEAKSATPGDLPTQLPKPTKPAWSRFDEDIPSHSADKLLQELRNQQHGGDSLDMSITSLAVVAAVAGRDLWTYVQTMPHLFSVGGLFYRLVERDLGLVHGNHSILPNLPGKIFIYNATEDRLELCLEPHGHFAIEPNVESNAKEIGRKATSMANSSQPLFGSSGAVGHQPDNCQVAFSGQGHSLRTVVANDRMPQDMEVVRKHGAKKNPNKRQDSIPEETVEGSEKTDVTMTDNELDMECNVAATNADVLDMNDSAVDCNDSSPHGSDVAKSLKPEEVIYKRIGPGYSVISSSLTNSINEQTELLKSLTEHIEADMKELDEDADDYDADDNLTEEMSDS